MKEIILATQNKNKLKEVQEILPDYIIKSMSDFNLDIDIEENGKTFEENAIIKSRTVCNILNKIVIADDSGLEIDYLNGEPGIYSARYLGRDTSYEEKNRIILDRMKDATNRTARFICAISISYPNGEDIVVKGIFEGEISKEIRGNNGFGYDPIFYVPSEDKTAAELSRQRKNEISHRGKALMKLAQKLNSRGE